MKNGVYMEGIGQGDGIGQGESHYWQNIELTALRDVYLPAEDSELLAEQASHFAYGRVLEVGCGSGMVSIACARKLEVSEVAATDISESAIKCAKENVKRNKIGKIKFYRGDLFKALPKSAGKFDTILFNPPYLPTNASEKVNGRLNAALDGGKEGISVASRFIREADAHLARGGKILMVASTAQNLKKLAKIAKECGFRAEICAKHDLFFEQLQIWKIERA